MDSNKWGEFPLDVQQRIHHFHMGDLHLWIQHKEDEIWIGHEYEKTNGKLPELGNNPPEELTWARWALKDFEDSVYLNPAFPELPIIVHSEYQLKVTPGSSINIYTRIPIWVRITIGKKKALLTELPTVKLSRTWFGSPLEGELCYWATTKARRSLSNVEQKSFLVNCPIHISNKTGEDLNFDKFCFRVERLKIFLVGNELWADETRIMYQGEEQYSDISMSGRLPKGMNKGKLLTEPRKPAQRSLATRTFRKIFDDNFIFGR